MMRKRKQAIALGLGSVMSIAASMATAQPASSSDKFDETKATTTLFAFDQVSIPFIENLKVEMREPKRHAANPVVPRGPKGSPDSWAVQFYGSIVREDGKFRMWYVAAGDERVERKGDRSEPWKVAYAESDDGVKWTKPNLGLVEYRGSKSNNLVLFNNDPIGILNVKVLRDDDDADAARRYKMTGHVWFPRSDKRYGSLATWVSPDGLRWTSTN